jgi:DnaJ like chaperone protein
MIAGKVIGGLLGYYSFGLFGAIFGLAIGHFFDKSFGVALGFDYSGQREKLQQLFFEATFSLMGHLAKADGRVSEEEIQQSEALFNRLGLTPEHRQQAIELFKQGTQPDFNLEATLSQFIQGGGRSHNLPTLLLEFLIVIAMADGEIHPAERDVLLRTASALGISKFQFQRLLDMLTAQESFSHQYQQAHRPPSREEELSKAYQALGVESSVTDKELKRAYRKLMSQHHPDKLIAQGVPEDMLKMATEKSQEIQAAYELIKKSRG